MKNNIKQIKNSFLLSFLFSLISLPLSLSSSHFSHYSVITSHNISISSFSCHSSHQSHLNLISFIHSFIPSDSHKYHITSSQYPVITSTSSPLITSSQYHAITSISNNISHRYHHSSHHITSTSSPHVPPHRPLCALRRRKWEFSLCVEITENGCQDVTMKREMMRFFFLSCSCLKIVFKIIKIVIKSVNNDFISIIYHNFQRNDCHYC